jgi:hypothetical protein
MKTKVILTGVIALLLLQAFIRINSNTLIGTWEYQYSVIGDSTQKIDIDKFCPVEKMIFSQCNDRESLKKFPATVKNLRKGNVLENICCNTYNQNKLIDTYFPVILTNPRSVDTSIAISYYGYRYKSFYIINKWSDDTLIFCDDKVRVINGKEYTSIKHTYVKKQ